MNKTVFIKNIVVNDSRFELGNGAGSDAVHTTPIYAYAVCKLKTDSNLEGIGLAFTLGTGNNIVCEAIKYLSKHIEGKEINELMSNFGETYKTMAEDPNFRWLGPHKGVVHLALASVVNACFDLWAKSRDLPLWKLLLELSPEDIVNTLELSYLEDILTRDEAISMLITSALTKQNREGILTKGYPGYDTSIGWFNYSDEKVRDNIKKTMDLGFTAMKLKVGSKEHDRDIRRAYLVRETAGDEATVMLDVNQQWHLPEAIQMGKALKGMNPYWIEEPTHPDDVAAHVTISKAIAPIKLALGEHVPNKIIFKNFLQSGCMSFNQVDAVRVGGISEFLTVSLMSKKFNVPVVPHVGDMGQIHQHLVLYNHVGMEHEALFLEHIPHLQTYFKNPVIIKNGVYQVPQTPGMSSDLLNY